MAIDKVRIAADEWWPLVAIWNSNTLPCHNVVSYYNEQRSFFKHLYCIYKYIQVGSIQLLAISSKETLLYFKQTMIKGSSYIAVW